MSFDLPIARGSWLGFLRDPQKKKLVFKWAKWIALAAVLICLYLAVRHDLRTADPNLWSRTHVNWLLVAASGLCLGGMNTVQMVRYRSLLYAYGAKPTWREMVVITWIPPLGKYLPFSVWSLLAAIAYLKKYGINAAIAVSVVIMVDAFSEVVGLIISTPLLMRPPVSVKFPEARWLAPPLLIAGVIVLAPPVFNRLLRFAMNLFKRPPLERYPTWLEYVIPVLSALAQWLFAGGALFLMTRAVAPVAFETYPQFVMIAAAAMALGYLAFVAPAGMGVRELIFFATLPPLLVGTPAGTVTMVTLAMRLMQILVELLLAGLGVLGDRGVTAPKSDIANQR